MKRTQTGFTLVELLVVIAIIGILMGLTIPAVNSAREAARRNQCATNMKNLALAGVQYAGAKGQLPGYVQDFGLFAGGDDPSDPSNTAVPRHKKIGTWAVALTPWLDAQPTYEHWTQDRYPVIVADPSSPPNLGSTSGVSGEGFHVLAAPNLAIFQCPSNPVSIGENGKNSFAYNNGMRPGGGIGFAGSQDRANGVGNSKYNVISIASNKGVRGSEGQKVRLEDFKDGPGNTILFSENVQALPWHRAGLIDGVDLVTADAAHVDVVFNALASTDVEAARYIHGLVWHYEDLDFGDTGMATFWNKLGTASPVVPVTVDSLHRINGGGTSISDDIFVKTIENISDARNLARPSSAHVDGVNCGMADGATRFVTQAVDYRVYQALMTPRGKSSDVPWQEFVLTDELTQ